MAGGGVVTMIQQPYRLHGYVRQQRSAGSGNRGVPTTPLAARLRMLRLHTHLNQRQFAPYVGPPARLSDWEQGIHEPTVTILKRYAKAFGMTVSQLLDGVM